MTWDSIQKDPPPEPEDPGRAAESLFLRRTQESRRHGGGHRRVRPAELGHDREPHGHVGRRHEDLAAHDPAGPLERLLKRHVDRALTVRDRGESEPVGACERNVGEQRAELGVGDRKGHRRHALSAARTFLAWFTWSMACRRQLTIVYDFQSRSSIHSSGVVLPSASFTLTTITSGARAAVV